MTMSRDTGALPWYVAGVDSFPAGAGVVAAVPEKVAS